MGMIRQNRFKRPAYSSHLPVDRSWHTGSDTEDLELGAWDNAEQPTASKGEAKESSQNPHSPRSKSQPTKLDSSTSPYIHSFTSRSRATTRRKYHRLRSRACSKVAYVVKLALMTIGLLQCTRYVLVLLEDIFPDELDLVSGAVWDSLLSSDVPNGLWTDRLDQLTEDIQPVMCHSHNDYWRREPLYQAIRTGCTGVEADVWLLNDELYVAHTAPGIREDRTLATLYLNPIMELLDHTNIVPDFLGPNDYDNTQRAGVFDTRPKQSLVLLIDFKNKPEEIWHRLVSLLTVFRNKGYLTYFNGSDVVNGPLTIVASGKAPFNRIIENSTYRHIFYDAPLENLDHFPTESFAPASGLNSLTSYSNPIEPSNALAANQEAIYSPFNSYYASVSFKRSIGWPYHSSINQTQLMKIRRQIRTAHSMGLKVRYWRIPEWPIGLRDYLWRVLVREGVDYLSVDDIEDVRWKNWGPRKGGWGKKWWR